MNAGQTIFAQVIDFFPLTEFRRISFSSMPPT